MKKLQLPSVTLIAVAGNKQAETIAAIYKSISGIDFASVKLITNIDITASGIECINVGGLKSWDEYNHFCVYRLTEFFDTSHVLICQWDGYILNPECWAEDFLKYDYIGAKWLDIGKPYNVANGGFSLRSKKLQDVLSTDRNIITYCPEDVSICKVYGQYLMDKYKIKFATEDVADKFSFELNQPIQKTFGFHGFHHHPYKPTVVIKRSHALGDVLMVEPVLHYYHKKGYNVCLNTDDYCYQFFMQHYFPVLHKSQLHPELKYTTIDLNSAYEVFPKQNHLLSYYQFAQIPPEEMVMRNPVLSLSFDPQHPQHKLFKKYAIIHNDVRKELHRNLYGIDWEAVVIRLKALGYDVVQLGNGKNEPIKGAIQMNTPTALFLMWVIGGGDLFIGIDSGLSHVASGFNIPSIILSGSVDMKIIHADLTNKICINNHEGEGVCKQPYCWHNYITESAEECYITKGTSKIPPCVKFSEDQVISAINTFEKKKNLKQWSYDTKA